MDEDLEAENVCARRLEEKDIKHSLRDLRHDKAIRQARMME